MIVDMMARRSREEEGNRSGIRRITALGEPLLELQPAHDGGVQVAFGGDVVNSTLCLVRILPTNCTRISLVTALGNSGYSAWLRARLLREGIYIAEPVIDGAPGIYGLSLDPEREPRLTYWRRDSAACAFLQAMDFPTLSALLGSPQVLIVTGVTLALCSHRSFEHLCQWIQVHRQDCRVVFDCNYRKPLWNDESEARRRIQIFEELASVVATGCEDETALWGTENIADIIERLGQHPGEYLIRGGSHGCWIGFGKDWQHISTESVPVVNATGAGDAHLAGFIAARDAGCSRIEAARYANKVAAVILRQRGAAPETTTQFPKLPISCRQPEPAQL